MAMSTTAGPRWVNPAMRTPGNGIGARGTAMSTPVQSKAATSNDQAAVKESRSFVVSFGASSMGTCPTPGSSSTRAPGIRA